MNNYIFELLPKYDGRKSFYKKAYVEVNAGTMFLYSYDTLVAALHVTEGFHLCPNVPHELLFSNTTLRHIKEFYRQFVKNEKITKKELLQFIYS